MDDTLKIIFIALLIIAALLVMFIIYSSMDPPEIQEPAPTHSGGIILPPIAEPDDGESEDEPSYVYVSEGSGEYVFYRGKLELPVQGSTGWAATNLVVRSEASSSSDRVTNLSPGDAFVIFDEVGDWWYVILPNELSGWVEINRCFINLPDVIPSIIYNISNAVSSEFRSSGVDLPDITHNNLYSAYSYNDRLERSEYIVPGLYSLAHALFAVQQLALSNGETLIVYEVYRPMETQRRVATSLNRLMNRSDPEYNELVYRAITDSPWTVGNFISQGRSNHQLGAAIDSSIGVVEEREILRAGDFSYHSIKYYSRLAEPSPIHELSPRAALPDRNSASATQIDNNIWGMKSYFEVMGFTPIASEWWHFNHTASVRAGSSVGINGNFFTPVVYSIPPFIG